MKIPGWAIFLIILAAGGLLGFLVYWFGFRDTDASSTATATDSRMEIVFTSNSLFGTYSREDSNNVDDPLEFKENCTVAEWDSSICECQGIVDSTTGVTRPPHFNGEKYQFLHQMNTKFLFAKWHSNDFRVKLENITGRFDGISIVFGEDMWSTGFDPDPEIKAIDDQEELLDEMVTNVKKNSVLILGNSAVPTQQQQQQQSTEGMYEFNVQYGAVIFSDKEALTSKEIKLASTAQDQRGLLRIALRYLTFYFTLNNTQREIRILISSSIGRMGDVLLKKADDIFYFYDLDSNSFKLTRPNNPSTMWNRNRNSMETESNESLESMLTSLTSEQVLPIPIALTNKPDWAKLKHSMAVDLIMGSHVGFRNQQNSNNLTDTDIILNFTLNSISLTATLLLQ